MSSIEDEPSSSLIQTTEGMSSLEDDPHLFLPGDSQPSSTPIQPTKLRRLKKNAASSAAATAIAPSPEAPKMPDSDGSDQAMDVDDGLDPLFSVPSASEAWPYEDLGEDEEEEHRVTVEKEKVVKKRLSWEGGDESEDNNIKKKKEKRSKSGGIGGVVGESQKSARERRKFEKERKAQLAQIHVESQRLLRETRDASFKPAPFIQKPISSVLEKIRLRKLEVLKRSGIFIQSGSFGKTGFCKEEIALESDISSSRSDGCGNRENPNEEEDVKDTIVSPLGGNLQTMEDATHNEAYDQDFTAAQTSAGGTQDACNGSLLNHGEKNELDENAATISKDSPSTSFRRSCSNSDPADDSSSEEDNDKENINPHPYKVRNIDSYPKGDLGKPFVDEEAEEEDDSDHDIMRFQENDEDDESDDGADLDDLIATGYEEVSVDQERRNQLHQKWLEQQDAAETNNVLQRLKHGERQREPEVLLDDEDGADSAHDLEDKLQYDQIPVASVRSISKKAKQMIAEMFTDEHDDYIPSDDEETEQTLARQRLFNQTEEKLSLTSPLEDENSREVFGLIKKLNIAPDSKRRGKISRTSFEMLVSGGNSNNSSKSSFLGRSTSCTLSSSHKQGSTSARTFIFGRDDSNSRSSMSTSESVSDMNKNQQAKSVKVKVSSSQFKLNNLMTNTVVEASSSSSLFEILRNSINFDDQSGHRNQLEKHMLRESQAAYQFSAFKLGKKTSRLNARN